MDHQPPVRSCHHRRSKARDYTDRAASAMMDWIFEERFFRPRCSQIWLLPHEREKTVESVQGSLRWRRKLALDRKVAAAACRIQRSGYVEPVIGFGEFNIDHRDAR